MLFKERNFVVKLLKMIMSILSGYLTNIIKTKGHLSPSTNYRIGNGKGRLNFYMPASSLAANCLINILMFKINFSMLTSMDWLVCTLKLL